MSGRSFEELFPHCQRSDGTFYPPSSQQIVFGLDLEFVYAKTYSTFCEGDTTVVLREGDWYGLLDLPWGCCDLDNEEITALRSADDLVRLLNRIEKLIKWSDREGLLRQLRERGDQLAEASVAGWIESGYWYDWP